MARRIAAPASHLSPEDRVVAELKRLIGELPSGRRAPTSRGEFTDFVETVVEGRALGGGLHDYLEGAFERRTPGAFDALAERFGFGLPAAKPAPEPGAAARRATGVREGSAEAKQVIQRVRRELAGTGGFRGERARENIPPPDLAAIREDAREIGMRRMRQIAKRALEVARLVYLGHEMPGFEAFPEGYRPSSRAARGLTIDWTDTGFKIRQTEPFAQMIEYGTRPVDPYSFIRNARKRRMTRAKPKKAGTGFTETTSGRRARVKKVETREGQHAYLIIPNNLTSSFADERADGTTRRVSMAGGAMVGRDAGVDEAREVVPGKYRPRREEQIAQDDPRYRRGWRGQRPLLSGPSAYDGRDRPGWSTGGAGAPMIPQEANQRAVMATSKKGERLPLAAKYGLPRKLTGEERQAEFQFSSGGTKRVKRYETARGAKFYEFTTLSEADPKLAQKRERMFPTMPAYPVMKQLQAWIDNEIRKAVQEIQQARGEN